MTKLRAAIYARHSSDKQNQASSDDQAAACEDLVDRLGAVCVGTFSDPEISGYRRDRSGLLRLLQDVAAGRIDIVVCEAIDRIARDGEDISWLGKKLSYHRARLHTHVEGEIDEIKLAVAGLLGSMFLSNLRAKTFRGLKAAVLAGRLAGGKAYGYRKVVREDETGRSVNGVFEIDLAQAAVVERIHRDFADGRSSIQIATALNREGVPSPRGGEWNASTIRGDPRKLVGILNNPLYRGRLVWGRREWRKNPDSDRRERRYRIRDEREWILVDMPDLRIVDEALASRVDGELERRRRPAGGKVSGAMARPRHLLSGLLKCGSCGANLVLAGKDYYRCARNRERGTCSNRMSVRLAQVEDAVLGAIQTQLLTQDLVTVFTREFEKEVDRLTRSKADADADTRRRIAELDAEIESLARHFLAGTVSPTLTRMLHEREAEREALTLKLRASTSARPVVPHPSLLRLYEEKIERLRSALNDDLVRDEAASVLRSLVAGVTVHSDEEARPILDIEASLSTLIDFAQMTNAPRRKDGGRSMMVVAGAGFEPATFRL